MRKYASWVDGFLQFTSEIGSPMLFRKWTGIFTVAAALERKVWIKTNKGQLFPNMYVCIIGPAGVGKTVASSIASEFLSKLEDHHIGSTSVTRASLIDDLRDATRSIVRLQDNPPTINFNSLCVISNELGVLIPSYENDFMNILTDLWDCREYSERRRTKDLKFKIQHPQLNLIAATTPSYLNNLIPEGAWDQGFLSRVLLVYSGESEPVDLFTETNRNAEQEAALTADLRQISTLYGRMQFSEDAAQAITEWHKAKGPPEPDHPKLVNYNVRRTAHLLKLCQVACASTSEQLIITLDHYAEALDWLLEMEKFIPDIFKSMSAGGDSNVLRETWYHVYHLWMKERKPIAEHRIIHFIQERTPAHNVGRILEVLVRGQRFSEEMVAGVGKAYVPRPLKT